MSPVTVIMGPTASGKSAMALELARRCDGEIISADSMQLYRLLPIGTAQPSRAEREAVPHHLVGIYELDVKSDVYSFVKLADAAIAEVRRRHRHPIVVGGTGMYLKALLYGLDPLPGDDALRRELDEQYDSEAGMPALSARLAALDPDALAALAPNRRKMIRALEVFLLTGKSLLALQRGHAQLRFPVQAWCLLPDPAELRARIAARAGAMLKLGWIEEARTALAAGLATAPTAHQALGYKLIGRHLDGEFDRAELETRIVTATWQFARRQMTWFRHQHPEAIPANADTRIPPPTPATQP